MEKLKPYDTCKQAENAISLPSSVNETNPYLVNGIESYKTLREVNKADLTLKDHLFIMQDDSRYVLREFLPNNQRYFYFVDSFPALATRVNGFNSIAARLRAKAGIPSRIIGTDQKPGTTLEKSAIDAHRILSVSDTQTAICHPDTSVIDGISMGAMKAMPYIHHAKYFARDIAYAIAVDPCFANQTEFNFKLLMNVGYTTSEISELTRVFIDESFNMKPLDYISWVRRMLGSVALSNTLDNFIMLCAGEAGIFAQHLPYDTAMSVHLFSNSRFNHQHQFIDYLKDMPNISIILEQGWHLSIASHQSTILRNQKHLLIQNLLREGANKQDLKQYVFGNILPKEALNFKLNLLNKVPNFRGLFKL